MYAEGDHSLVRNTIMLTESAINDVIEQESDTTAVLIAALHESRVAMSAVLEQERLKVVAKRVLERTISIVDDALVLVQGNDG